MPGNTTVRFKAIREVVIEDRDVPTPSAGELLIRTSLTLISTGTELAVLEGKVGGNPRAPWGQLPFDPGYNNIGIVEQVGEGVDDTWLGRRVAAYGPHQQYIARDVDSARPIPDSVPDEQAVFFTLAEIAMNGVRRSQVTWGESVVVFGMGLVGQLAARFCRLAGADPLVVVDVAPSRLDLMPDAPGVHKVNPKQDDVEQAVEQITRGRMADVAFEVTGLAQLIESETCVLHKLGRFVMLSSPRGSSTFDFHAACNQPSYTIIGAHNGSHPPTEDVHHPWSQKRHCELFFDWLAAGRLDMLPLVSHRAAASDAVAMYDMLLTDRTQAMGVVLDWRG